ncbi:MAG: hypothetical protein ACRDSJ_15915, partial [Rubrobacteraceae bacterium]
VMIREDLTPISPHAMMVVTPANGLSFQRRVNPGGSSSATSGGAGAAPYWVKVVRTGKSFYGYRSPDGVAWTLVKRVSITMGSNAYIGLVLTSHTNAVSASATFDNIALTP